MTLAASMVAEMRFQDRALSLELDAWAHLHEREPAYKAHASQLERICRTIESARSVLGLAVLDQADDAQLEVGLLHEQRRRLRALHLLWNFFRSKLMQRLQPDFRDFLRAADDLAWAVYAPFLERLAGSREGLREPPLVFLALEPAPFAQGRRSSFLPPGLTEREQNLMYAIIRKLPVPIIGVPWLQLGHLPDLCLVGHEAAHIVADDLGLYQTFPALLAALDEIPAERADHWLRWFDELFADILGLLAAGAGFGCALTRALADDAGVIRDEAPDRASAYPPRHVRVAAVRAAAACAGVSTWFADEWRAAYDPPETAYTRDAERIAEALLEREFDRLGGARLAQVLPPPEASAVAACADALADEDPLPRALDIRAAIAGASVAHARGLGPGPGDRDPYRRLARHIAAERVDGYRGEGLSRARAGAGPTDGDQGARLAGEDDTIGREIASLLGAGDLP